MTTRDSNANREDLEHQFDVVREDLATLTRLLREAGEAQATKKRDELLAEAAELIERSQSVIGEGRARARQATASIEDQIREKPLQSALIALGIGFLVGMISRR